MGPQEQLIEKISDTLLEIGLSNEIIDKFERYIDGDLEEKEFLSCLPNIDMNSLNKETVEEIVHTHKSLDRHKAEDYIGKYIRIIVQIGQISAFGVVDKFWSYYRKDNYKRLIKYKIDAAFIIAYHADAIVYSENSLDMSFIRFFDSLYEEYADSFRVAFNMSDINQQIIIAAYLIKKDGNKYKELCEWLEAEITGCIENIFDNISDCETDIVNQYLKGETQNLEDVIELLKRNNALSMADYILKLFIGVSFMTRSESELIKRFIKLAIAFDYDKSFRVLYSFLREQRYNRITKLMDELQIKRELNILWMGFRTNGYSCSYEKELKEELNENKEEYISAVSKCCGIGKVYMASLLWEIGEGSQFIKEGEEVFIDEFSKFMSELNVEKSIYESFIPYLRGEAPFENIKKTLNNLLGKKEFYIYHQEYSKILFRLKDVSPIFERAMKVFIAIGNSDILRRLYDEYKGKNRNELGSFIDLLEELGASTENCLPFLGNYAVITYGNSETAMEARNIITKLITKDENKFIESIAVCNADIRAYLLEKIFKCNKAKNAVVLIEYLSDSSKVVKERVIELLSAYEECHKDLISSLSSKKQAIREGAVKILSNNKSEKIIEALNKALETEKTEKIKILLRDVLNVESDLKENKEELNIVEYCIKALKGNKAAALKWLDFDTLPKVKLKDSDKLAEDEIIKFMLVCYASNGEIALNAEAQKVSKLLNTQDLAELALQVFEKWLDSGAEMKKKWILSFAAINGDYRLIALLKKNIETWPQNSRGAVASEAVKALALNGSNEALIIVDSICRKFKFKQVKSAAASALEFAAKEIGIDMEELSDKIVPDLGFDIRGERVFDFGDRKFTVILTPELNIEVLDESGKKLKNLPKPTKKDDEVKANNALLEFKMLKKQLKTTINIQAIRLEMALSTNRKWTKEAWIKLFVENPIMQQFAIGLVWGNYKDNGLTNTFRYMEDGTFNTMDEDEYELEDTMMIGIVHPIELTEGNLSLWKDQLENYEIKQPFEQLNRELFKVTEEEKNLKRVERFGGAILNGLSLLGKLTGFGWYRGSIQDAGGYYTFYKEDTNLEIGVEIEFSGMCVGYENEEVTIYGLTFYKSGTVERGSYVYDKIKENNIIVPSEVPSRFFSEILYQVSKVTASKIETNENWRKEEQ